MKKNIRTTEAQILKKYNKEENYLFISEYAESKNSHTGLSSFTRNTARFLKRYLKQKKFPGKIIVLAEHMPNRPEVYEHAQTLIIRAFQKNRPQSFIKLLSYAVRLYKVKHVYFEFEFASYGTLKTTIWIPLVVAALRLMGKNVIFLMHQVVLDLSVLNHHLGLSRHSLSLSFLQIGLELFYRFIGRVSDKVVVLEEELKERLSHFVNPSKISVIPHGVVPSRATLSRKKARTLLGIGRNEIVLLVFGYITWYKGTDRIIDAALQLPKRIAGKRVRIIVAGGASPTQKNQKHYEQFYQSVVEKSAKISHVTITGFIPEAELAQYFEAADCVVLPYRRFISSSGPLSLAISYGKPILFSKELSPYLKSPDFNKIFQASRLTESDLFIPISALAIEDTITRFIKKPSYKRALEGFTKNLMNERSWNNISRHYMHIATFEKIHHGYDFILNYK